MTFKTTAEYVICDDVIISYLGKKKIVRVPSIIDGKNIRRIGAGAFFGCPFIEEIIIEDGIEEIGKKAFANCKNLRFATIPESVDVIEDDIFLKDEICMVDFYIKIPYSKYISIKEESIKLTDGRYILDYMLLGGEYETLIRGFMSKGLTKRFNIDRSFGYLLINIMEHRPSDTRADANKTNEVLLFEDYCNEFNIDPNSLEAESIAFRKKFESGLYETWFEHDEAEEDKILARVVDLRDLSSALLFLVEEGSINDSDIKIRLLLRKEVYYFQGGTKIRVNNRDYYLCQNEFLINDENNPYARKILGSTVLTEDLDLAGDIEMKAVIEKYKILTGLI